MNSASPTIATITHRGYDFRIITRDASPQWIDPTMVANLEWRPHGEDQWHTDQSWPEEHRGRRLPAAVRTWAEAHAVRLDDQVVARQPTRAAIFDLRMAGRSGVVVDVTDLRPRDFDTGKRLALEAGAGATCDRCARSHAVVWTIAVGDQGTFTLGSSCAATALGVTKAPADLECAARHMQVIRPFLRMAVQANTMIDARGGDVVQHDRRAIQVGTLLAYGVVAARDLALLEIPDREIGFADARRRNRCVRAITALSSAMDYIHEGHEAWKARFLGTTTPRSPGR